MHKQWQGLNKSLGYGGLNADSGRLNTDSGKHEKVFTRNQNRCSGVTRINVHGLPEWVFRGGQNMQHDKIALHDAVMSGLAVMHLKYPSLLAFDQDCVK